MIKRLHHTAIIVSSEAGVDFYKELGFIEENRIDRGYDQIVWMSGYEETLELFIDGSHPERMTNPETLGLRHLAFEVDDVDAEWNRLSKYNPEPNNAINMLWNYFSFAISGNRKVESLDSDFDVVFINQLSPVMMALPGIKYAKKYGKKSVLYCYDLWPASLSAGGIRKGSIIYNLFDKISKKIYRQVDKIAVTSKSFIEYFRDEHQIDEKKITFLPQYCEELFSNIEKRVKDGTYNFVFAGNIGMMQSVETIVKAAELIKNEKNIKIHIVGDGRDFENCRKLAEKLKTQNVIFYGRRPVEEMPKFYSIADAMIVTLAKDELISKTLPGKVQSYMAAGKPIIASADGETKIVIEDADCGWVCKSEDYNSLAHLFRVVSSTSQEKISEFEKNSYTYFQSHYSIKAFNTSFDRILED